MTDYFDFTRPNAPGTQYEHERPFLVHLVDNGTVDGAPEVLVGEPGELHNELRDKHDVGLEVLRGYVSDTGSVNPNDISVESGNEKYLPLVEKYVENMGEEEDWPTDKYATLDEKKWAYLNGDVGFGDFHHQILDTLAERQKLPGIERGLLSNLALVNAHPGNINHDIAWGQFHQGYPVFWKSNVDRNHIWDAVQNARNTVEPPMPVLAGLKIVSALDALRVGMTDSGGQLAEIQPGGTYLNYDGQSAVLPEPKNLSSPTLDRTQTYYAANVESHGQIQGSVSIEVEANRRRNGETWQEVIIHDAYVAPQYRGTDVWLKLYRWIRQHWPHDRIFGEFANQDLGEFFEKDNRRNFVGDDSAWEQTGVGDATGTQDSQQPYDPMTYGNIK